MKYYNKQSTINTVIRGIFNNITINHTTILYLKLKTLANKK